MSTRTWVSRAGLFLLSLGFLAASAGPLCAQGDSEPAPNAPAAGEPEIVVRGRAGTLERLPARPELTPEQRTERAAELRKAYTQPTEKWPAPTVDAGVTWHELGLLPPPAEYATAPDNAWTAEKARLGQKLFFDPRLSASGQIACASCHDPDLAWGDGRTTAYGHARKPLKRNAPSILNAAYQPTLFWDGRANSLEDQAVQVLLNPNEMRSDGEHLGALLERTPEYRAALQSLYEVADPGVKEIAAAIACFERTLVGGRSKFDTFLRGRSEALNNEELFGLHVFRTTARCMNCHSGPTFSDGKFHNLGLSYYGRTLEDRGRYEVTQNPADVGRFRTPSLRNVSRTAPYMHNGIFPLAGVLNLYNAGMPTLMPKPEQKDDPLFPRDKSPQLKPLGLNKQDLADLLAFLEALEEPRTRVRPPELPGLYEKAE